MIFKNYDDNELLYLIKDGCNPRALEILVRKYNILSLKIIRSFQIFGADEDDLLSEANGVLMKCIASFSDNSSFYSYFSISLKRYLIRRQQSNQYYLRLGEDIIDKTNVENQAYSKRLTREIYEVGNLLQKQITNLILEGYTTKEIANKLNLPVNKIYYEMRKLRNKVKEL